jgi:hypothetical protein
MASTAHAATDLDTALLRVRTTCRGISNDLEQIKTMAGAGIASGAIGTVSGGVALGAGIAKSKTDAEVKKWKELLQDQALQEIMNGNMQLVKLSDEEINRLKDLIAQSAEVTRGEEAEVIAEQEALVEGTSSASAGDAQSGNTPTINLQEVDLTSVKTEIEGNIDELESKSKRQGNLRTGTLAVSTVSNLAGAIVSAADKSRVDLRERVSACMASVKELSAAYDAARTKGDINIDTAVRVNQIVDRCGQWKSIDVAKIGDVGTGATVSSVVGTSTGLAGTITSASANKTVDGRDAAKTEKLNKASHVLAGTTAVASGVSTILQATRMKEINAAISVAKECEGALK